MTDTRFFYVIKTIGTHYKTGIAEDVERRLRNYRTVAPQAIVVDTWLCPMDIAQERRAQHRMHTHTSCTWAGGETFDVRDEAAFLAELRSTFGETKVEVNTTERQEYTSTFKWSRDDVGYSIVIPGKPFGFWGKVSNEKMSIRKTSVPGFASRATCLPSYNYSFGEWELSVLDAGHTEERLLGYFDTASEALRTADEVLVKCRPRFIR